MNYGIRNLQSFPQDFIENVNIAKVVFTSFGYEVEFQMKSGETWSLPLYDDSFVSAGDTVDLQTAEIVTLDLGNGNTSSAISILSCNYDIEVPNTRKFYKNITNYGNSKDVSGNYTYPPSENRKIYSNVHRCDLLLEDYKSQWTNINRIIYCVYFSLILLLFIIAFLLKLSILKTILILVLLIVICVFFQKIIDNKKKSKYESLKNHELFMYRNELRKLEDKIMEEYI